MQVRMFTGQVTFLALIGAPALLFDSHRPMLFVLELQAMFGISALISLFFGVLSRQRISPTSLGVWDQFAALMLLKAGCSVALRLLA